MHTLVSQSAQKTNRAIWKCTVIWSQWTMTSQALCEFPYQQSLLSLQPRTWSVESSCSNWIATGANVTSFKVVFSFHTCLLIQSRPIVQPAILSLPLASKYYYSQSPPEFCHSALGQVATRPSTNTDGGWKVGLHCTSLLFFHKKSYFEVCNCRTHRWTPLHEFKKFQCSLCQSSHTGRPGLSPHCWLGVCTWWWETDSGSWWLTKQRHTCSSWLNDWLAVPQPEHKMFHHSSIIMPLLPRVNCPPSIRI